MRHVLPRPLTFPRLTFSPRCPPINLRIPPASTSTTSTLSIPILHIQFLGQKQHLHNSSTIMAPSHQSSSSSPTSQPLKILMLHGYTQNGPLFHAKTRALEKHLHKSFPGSSLVYPTAPVRIHAADLASSISNFDADTNSISKEGAVGEVQALNEPDAFGWWIRQGAAEPYYYDRMDEGLAKLATVLKEEGPFDGVIGFSQGAALAGMLASLLEPGRYQTFREAHGSRGGMAYPPEFLAANSSDNNTSKDTSEKGGKQEEIIHPPLKFAVSYSGFGATTNSLYLTFYNPPITTPLLHFLGTLDTVVEEARSLRLLNSCEERLPLPSPFSTAESKESDKDKNGDKVFTTKEDYKSSRVVYHPGGHFLPSGKQYLAVLDGFIREIMGRYNSSSSTSSTTSTTSTNNANGVTGKNDAGKKKKVQEEEERVEDMDVPF